MKGSYLIDTTSHPLATALLHILEPRKPLPPATSNFFFAVAEAVVEAADAAIVVGLWCLPVRVELQVQ